MLNPNRLRRIAILGALACTLVPATAAAAQPSGADESTRLKSARAQERYYATGATEPVTDVQLRWAKAQERYYSSYGEPEPIAAPIAPASPDDTPWPTIALAAAVALAAGSIAAIHRRRLRLRRRLARAAT